MASFGWAEGLKTINPPIYRLTTAVSDIDQTNINRDIRDGNWLSSLKLMLTNMSNMETSNLHNTIRERLKDRIANKNWCCFLIHLQYTYTHPLDWCIHFLIMSAPILASPKNIAKSTTDLRVEFISQEHSSQVLNILQFQSLNFNRTSTSASRQI